MLLITALPVYQEKSGLSWHLYVVEAAQNSSGKTILYFTLSRAKFLSKLLAAAQFLGQTVSRVARQEKSKYCMPNGEQMCAKVG